MLTAGLFAVLAWCLARSSAQECPTLVPQNGTEIADVFGTVDAFLDPRTLLGLPGRVYLIRNGQVDNTVLTQFPPFPNFEVTIHLESSSQLTLHFALSVWSLNETVSPAGCPSPDLGVIAPGNETVVAVRFGCAVTGLVGMRVCFTVGTESFSHLNGTYHTFEFLIQRQCLATAESGCTVVAVDDVVPGELCISSNQSRILVNDASGSWNLLFGAADNDTRRGLCLIENSAGGLNQIVRSETLAMSFYIAEHFNTLEMEINRPDLEPVIVTSAISYSLSLRSENLTVVGDPAIIGIPGTGVSTVDALVFTLSWPCLAEGLARLSISFSASALINGTLYRMEYLDVPAYRNCTPEARPENTTTVVVKLQQQQLAVQISLPIVAFFLILVSGGILVILILIYTTKYRKKTYEIEQQMQEMAECNVYFEVGNHFEFLNEYDIEYNYASLELISELGEGAFGRVFKARAPGIKRGAICEPEFVAVKTLKNNPEGNLLEEFRKEVKTCVDFSHKNVVMLLGVCLSSVQKCMIFEYMDIGSLSDLLRLSDPDNPEFPGTNSKDPILITPDQFLFCVVQVGEGLQYLARQKFVHRDIASRNCLIDHNMVVKIADFGMSRDIHAMDYYRIGANKAPLPVRWMPPEALLYGKFTVKSDVWSFGVFMWEVYTFGRQPYGGITNYEVIDRVKTEHVLECPQLAPASVYDIMKSCWTRIPARRPDMDAIQQRIHRLIQASLQESQGYTRMAPLQGPEGYMNLAFGIVAPLEEIDESKHVQALQAYEETSNSSDKDAAEVSQTNPNSNSNSSTSTTQQQQLIVASVSPEHTPDAQTISPQVGTGSGSTDELTTTRGDDCLAVSNGIKRPTASNEAQEASDNDDDPAAPCGDLESSPSGEFYRTQSEIADGYVKLAFPPRRQEEHSNGNTLTNGLEA